MRLLTLIFAAAAAFALAAPAGTQPHQVPPPPAPQLARADLEAWVDGMIPPALARGDIAGAVVVVVKDGQILLQKGYGYADVARRRPVDPAATLFRPGSVSKLFTWTAVMQLVEQGRIDLDADINRYLDFRVAGRGGKPITMRHLMTHTAGFEETLKDLIGADPKGPPALRAYLSQWVPKRLYDPGTTPAYSNYGTALAGYIVQRVSRASSYDAYIEQNILRPLGMARSSMRQPLPAHLQPLMSKGYERASAPPLPYEMVAVAPAGSLAATGSDMARFMLANLQGGALGNARILRPETARQMQETAMTPRPLHVMKLGFIDLSRNGRRIIGHNGDSMRFHSDMQLLPDEKVGFFLSLNSSGRDGAAQDVRDRFGSAFLDRYYPAPKAPLRSSVDAGTALRHARQVAGYYEISRRGDSSLLSLGSLMMPVKVVEKDGSISIPLLTGDDGKPKVWREVSPYVWQETDGPERFGAIFKQGKVAIFGGGTSVLVPLPWWRSGIWLMQAAAVALLILLVTVLAWPIAALVRRHYGIPFALKGRRALAYQSVRVAALAAIVTLAGFALLMGNASSGAGTIGKAQDGILWTLQIAALFAIGGGTLLALWNNLITWTGGRRWPARLWSLAILLAFAVLLWLSLVTHLIAFDVNY